MVPPLAGVATPICEATAALDETMLAEVGFEVGETVGDAVVVAATLVDLYKLRRYDPPQTWLLSPAHLYVHDESLVFFDESYELPHQHWPSQRGTSAGWGLLDSPDIRTPRRRRCSQRTRSSSGRLLG